MNILSHIPSAVLRSVQQHLKVIAGFNAEVQRARALEQRLGAPGRYEWEFRLDHEAQVDPSMVWMARFAAHAATLGIDTQAVYAALGVTPVLLPWSADAQEWRRAD